MGIQMACICILHAGNNFHKKCSYTTSVIIFFSNVNCLTCLNTDGSLYVREIDSTVPLQDEQECFGSGFIFSSAFREINHMVTFSTAMFSLPAIVFALRLNKQQFC